MAGAALAIGYVNHNPLRKARFSSSSGTWLPGDVALFSPSGASGQVVALDTGSHELTYYLLEGLPALGDGATTSSGTATACSLLEAEGDTFVNDGRTFLFVDNQGAQAITLRFLAQAECSDGYLHDLAITIGPGVSGPIGPFNRRRFNDGGRVRVVYAGTVTPVECGVAAVRMFPNQ
jgi:hypothetical protein